MCVQYNVKGHKENHILQLWPWKEKTVCNIIVFLKDVNCWDWHSKGCVNSTEAHCTIYPVCIPFVPYKRKTFFCTHGECDVSVTTLRTERRLHSMNLLYGYTKMYCSALSFFVITELYNCIYSFPNTLKSNDYNIDFYVSAGTDRKG